MDPSQPLTSSNPYWIYPLHIIQLKLTSTTCKEITLQSTFLCVTVKLTKPFIGSYTSRINWKKDKLPCNNISYIFLHSNRPRNQSYNVAISQVMPIIYSASSAFLAYLDILKLVELFHNNGFKQFHLHKIIINFLKTNSFPGIRFKIELLIELLLSGQ